jgi:Cu(I)/Ag(I) efflux system membrane fusion protein
MRNRSIGLLVAAALAIGIGAGFWLGGRGAYSSSQPVGEEKSAVLV